MLTRREAFSLALAPLALAASSSQAKPVAPDPDARERDLCLRATIRLRDWIDRTMPPAPTISAHVNAIAVSDLDFDMIELYLSRNGGIPKTAELDAIMEKLNYFLFRGYPVIAAYSIATPQFVLISRFDLVNGGRGDSPRLY